MSVFMEIVLMARPQQAKGKGRKSLKERGFKTHTKSCLQSQHWPDTGLVKKKNIINVYQYNVSPQYNVSV